MKLSGRVPWALFLLCPFACDDGPARPTTRLYHEPTAPESLVYNLDVAYEQRDLAAYFDLLAPEFAFHFLPADAAEFGTSAWTRGEDSTGTRALFTSPLVDEVHLEMSHGPAFPAQEQSLPPGTMKIRLTAVFLVVVQTDRVAWGVTHLQDFACRRGRVAAGEDTTRWFFLDWTELSQSPQSPSPPEMAPQPVSELTWGRLKRLYLPPPLVGP